MCKQIKRLTALSECPHLNKTDRDAITFILRETGNINVEKENGFNGFDFSSWPSIPDKKLIDDWSKTRKSKGKPIITQSFIDSCAEHLVYLKEKGIAVNKAISIAAQNGWQGFKCSWVIKEVEENKVFDINEDKDVNTPESWIKKVEKRQVARRGDMPKHVRMFIDTQFRLGKYPGHIMTILSEIGFSVN